MYGALLRSDYYEASAPPDGPQPATGLPFGGLAARRLGRPRVVPTFTTNRSRSEVPTSTPAASPRLRRRPSPWPPHRTPLPASELTIRASRPMVTRCDPGPYPSDLSRVELLRGIRQWFLAYTFSSLLAGPGPSDGADPSRTLSGLLPASPAFPGSACPQLHRAAATVRRQGPFIPARFRRASWRTGCSSTRHESHGV